MNLTLLYRGKKVRVAYRITMRQLISVGVLSSLFILVSSRSVQTADEISARIEGARSGNEQQQSDVDQLKLSTQQQLAGMMVKLARLEEQVQQIDNLGQRLVAQADLDPAEFSFQDEPSDQLVEGHQFDEQLAQNPLVLRIDGLLQSLEYKNKELMALERIMNGHYIEEQSLLSGRPIEKGWLSSYFGIRKDPFSGKPAMHKGVDFAGSSGQSVIATGAGIVTWAGERYGYGKLVEIDHGNGLSTRYGHNSELQVMVGDVVTKGQTVALMGNTGRSTGAHVHYEVLRNGEQLDPLPYVYRK